MPDLSRPKLKYFFLAFCVSSFMLSTFVQIPRVNKSVFSFSLCFAAMNIQPAVLCKVAKEDLHAFCDERAFILYSSSKKFFHDQRGGIHHQRSFIRHQRSSFIIKQACFTRNCDENTFMLYSSLSSRAETTLKTTLSPFPYLSSWICKIFGHLGILGRT